jgi:hypothetical protein
MHQFAMDFAACLVKYGNGEVRFIVTTFAAEARSEPLAMVDSFCIQRETLSNPIADRNAVFHIEIKRLQSHFGLPQANVPTTEANVPTTPPFPKKL